MNIESEDYFPDLLKNIEETQNNGIWAHSAVLQSISQGFD